jgi:hypothetical protein
VIRAVPIALAGALASGCGYHVAGKADLVPKSIQTVCVPEFSNATVKYRLTDRMPEAIAREFIARTRYRLVADPNEADAVLRGAVLNYWSWPTVFDDRTGRASAVQFQVNLQLTLVERATGKVLYSAPNFAMKDQYEISTTPRTYIEETDTALDRVSRQVARTLVSNILENF